MRTLSLDECRRLTIFGLNEQIKLRQELTSQMVGNLYPAIVCDEIATLREMVRERREVLDKIL